MAPVGCSLCGVGRTASNRVNRGGSWNNSARNCRAAYRNWNHPSNQWNNRGFRLARALGCAGWRGLDPADVASVGSSRGEDPTGPGVQVGGAEHFSNARRWPASAAVFATVFATVSP